MDLQSRYQIQGTLAQNDFVTVFRARDMALGRDVAIKQIHPQYLADPRRLEQFWREAQLLASIEHPFIVRIHDVDRARGWVILELVQGSIGQHFGGQPIDMSYLRLTLKYALHALQFLQQNGIVHGEVKPDNLLIDQAGRVKLGEFGIARRLGAVDGVVMGDTKYMAPEVVADDFGAVGIHSDLYSLGFSAYELMCGAHFESLFPGLNMFGADRKMAWMMWHSARDRRLPEIHRVLEGVPPDLAHVVERLIEKDPARRYQSPEVALADLAGEGIVSEQRAAAEAAKAEVEAAATRRRRMYAMIAVVASMLLSVGLLFLPTGEEAPIAQASSGPLEGVLQIIDAKRQEVILGVGEGERPVRLPIDPQRDRILLNDSLASLADLKRGDELVINQLTDADGQLRKEVIASRSIREDLGKLSEMDVGAGMLTVTLGSGDTAVRQQIYVPSNVKLELNGETNFAGAPVTLGTFRAGDRLVVRHVQGTEGRVATAVRAMRVVPLPGFLVSTDQATRKLTVRIPAAAGSAAPKPETWLLAEDCQIELNGVDAIDGKVLTLAQLKADDRLVVHHDTHVVRIEAFRQFSLSGVVRAVDPAARRLRVAVAKADVPIDLAVPASSPIRLAGEPNVRGIDLNYIRAGDAVTIVHESPQLENVSAVSVDVTPEPDRSAWALVIGQEDYSSAGWSQLAWSKSDAQLVYDTLRIHYRVPAGQIRLLIDGKRTDVAAAVTALLPKVSAGSQLIVWYSGHGFLEGDRIPYLAAKDFDRQAPEQTGVPLSWLVKQMEDSPAGEKILVLDCGRSGGGGDLPSAGPAEMATALKKTPARPVSTSVNVIAGCASGQQAAGLPERGHGLLALAGGEAWHGEADTDKDRRVSAAELFAHLSSSVRQLGAGGRAPTPVEFLPDATPPRFSDTAAEAVRAVLARLPLDRVDQDGLAAAYRNAITHAPDEPEPHLAYALVLIKAKKYSEAQTIVEEQLARHGDSPMVHHVLSNLHFRQRKYEDGIRDLTTMISQVPVETSGAGYSAYARHLFRWAGKLRGFTIKAVPTDQQPAFDLIRKLDTAVGDRGEQAREEFVAGYNELQGALAKIDEQIASSTITATQQSQLRLQRRFVATFAELDLDAVAAAIGLELQK